MTDINLPDDPAVPESMEPPAVAGGPSDEDLLSLDQLRQAWNAQADAANSWDELGIDEIVCWAQKQALARWGCPATPPAVTTRALLGSAYEPGDGSADGAQIVDLEWWHPIMGCDSLQVVVDNARAALAAPPAPAEGEVGELIQCLRIRAASLGAEGASLGQRGDARYFTRAADMLEQLPAAAPAVVPVAIPGEQWQENDRPCIWWRFPIEEPPWAGDPRDDDWPGYHTHFTRIVCPVLPLPSGEVEG